MKKGVKVIIYIFIGLLVMSIGYFAGMGSYFLARQWLIYSIVKSAAASQM